MSGSPVRGRRFLICHSIIHEIMGSTVVTLDLAEYLLGAGAEVVVYVAHAGEPAVGLFAERGVTVVTDREAGDLAFADFDVVWVNSQVLPVSMLDQLAAPLPRERPVFVFLHMSSLAIAPDEHPYLLGLEEGLASLSLYNSEETRRGLAPFFEHPPPAALYPNPTPTAFASVAPSPASRPHHVLVVSNHAAPELMRAKELFAERGIQVRHVGRSGEGQEMVTPELLARADVVITIGKTVQYCLVAGIPVFVLDKHGGYGYLDDDTVERAAEHNFSGREGRDLSAEQIVEEVVTGYDVARRFHERGRSAFIERYSIDRVVPRVLEGLRPRTVEPWDARRLAVVTSAQTFGARFYRYWGRVWSDVARIAETEGTLRTTAETLSLTERRLADREAEVDRLRREVRRIETSWTVRVGRLVVGPVGLVVRGVSRLVRARR